MVSKISWLDSTRHYSTIHLTSDDKRTLCGHVFFDKFKAKQWTPYRVGKRHKGFCKKCRSKVTKKAFKIATASGSTSWLIPANDTTKWRHHRHGAIKIK